MKITHLLKQELSQYTKNWSLAISMFIGVCISSFIVWYSGGNIFNTGYASLNILFSTYYWLLMIFVPYITMGKICDEKLSGTLELIMSKPISIKEVIFAKWLASFSVIIVMLISTIPFCITVAQMGNLDLGATIGGYTGLLLHGSMIISISLFTSANSKNSFNALFSTWITLLLLLAIPPSIQLLDIKGKWEILLMRFSLNEYFKYMGSGLIYIHGVVLYVSTTTIFGLLTGQTLAKDLRTRKSTIHRFIAIGCIATIIATSYCFPLRVDLTSTGKFSLSPITISTIKNNKLPINIEVFFSDNISSESIRYSRELFMLLRSFRAESETPITIKTTKVIDEKSAIYAKNSSIAPTIIDSEGGARSEAAYFGLTIQVGNSAKSVINPIAPNMPIEDELTRAIRQASIDIKPSIGIVYGHGEINTNQITGFISEISRGANISIINLDMEPSLKPFDVICIIGPERAFTPAELRKLNNYLSSGGRAFIALNHAIGHVNNVEEDNLFTINRTGIEDLLSYMGIKVNYDFIIDNNCGTLNISYPSRNRNSNTSIRFPYFPIITHFSNHLITSGLNSMILPFSSSIEQIKTETPYVFVSLAQTSSISGSKHAPIIYNTHTLWGREDFKAPHKNVAALITNENNGSAIVAIANSAFINDELISLFGNDNINFAVNSVEWLADNSGLIQLRNKFTTYPTIEKISSERIEIIKAVNAILPLIIILLILLFAHRKLR